MATEQQKELFTRYIAGKCTPEEERQVAWLLNSQAFDQDLLDIIESAMDAAPVQPTLSLERRAHLYNSIKSHVTSARKPALPWRAIAASLLLLVLAGGGWLYFSTKQVQPVVITYKEITSGNARQEVTMPDGTMIWLNSNSTLKYPNNYNKEERRVVLQGEAFFKVTHDATRPFIVAAEQLTTKVLGTSFNVLAEPAGEAVAITLVEGKVEVNKVDSLADVPAILAVLTPDQQIVYNKATGQTTVHLVQATDFSAWKDGILNLKNISFKEAVARMERFYSVTIKVTNPAIDQCIVHASFENESLSRVLDALGKVNNFTYTLKDRTVTITVKGCPAKRQHTNQNIKIH